MGYNLLINGVYWGYNPLTNHLLTSWDILVFVSANFLKWWFFTNLFEKYAPQIGLFSQGQGNPSGAPTQSYPPQE